MGKLITIILLASLAGNYYFWTRSRAWEAQALATRAELATALSNSCQRAVKGKVEQFLEHPLSFFEQEQPGQQ